MRLTYLIRGVGIGRLCGIAAAVQVAFAVSGIPAAMWVHLGGARTQSFLAAIERFFVTGSCTAIKSVRLVTVRTHAVVVWICMLNVQTV